MSGIPKAKLVPATALEEMVSEGAGFAGFAAGDVGQGPHDPDLVSIPDMNAMIVLPWRKNIAWVRECFRSRTSLPNSARAESSLVNWRLAANAVTN